ncbi:MAG TPA: hypothetical protein VN081_00040 [Dongiaceae bacterium]|nr:hypothetical protein [Dongiaceae bacterium]
MDALPDTYQFVAGSERTEYSPLSPTDMAMYAEMAQDEIEFLFMNVKTNRTGSYSRYEDSSFRQTFLDGRALAIEPDEPVWLYDDSNDAVRIIEFKPACNPCHLHVELRHMNFYDHEIVDEEYAVRLEKFVIGSTEPFVTFYRFVHYKGNVWQAEVERNNVDPFLLEGIEPSTYNRMMTAFDFQSFLREMEEVEHSYVSEEVRLMTPRSAV